MKKLICALLIIIMLLFMTFVVSGSNTNSAAVNEATKSSHVNMGVDSIYI